MTTALRTVARGVPRICNECGRHFCAVCVLIVVPDHDEVHCCPFCANGWLLGLDIEGEYHADADVYRAELDRRRLLGLPT